MRQPGVTDNLNKSDEINGARRRIQGWKKAQKTKRERRPDKHTSDKGVIET